MADKVTTTFPKVGKTNARPRNSSAMTTSPTQPRGHAVSASPVDTMAVKGRRNINERLGPVGVPQVTYAPAEDPSVGAQLRNTRMLKPAKGTGEFRRAGSGFPGGSPF